MNEFVNEKIASKCGIFWAANEYFFLNYEKFTNFNIVLKILVQIIVFLFLFDLV